MGMTTCIYGVIKEYEIGGDRQEEIYVHNESVILNLPMADDWPPLSREMFSITKNDRNSEGYNLEYWVEQYISVLA